jgi:hypothetical protein
MLGHLLGPRRQVLIQLIQNILRAQARRRAIVLDDILRLCEWICQMITEYVAYETVQGRCREVGELKPEIERGDNGWLIGWLPK